MIYRTDLLARSETFILSQALALRHFEPRFIGLQRTADTLNLPGEPTLVTNGSTSFDQIRKKLYRVTGVAPDFYRRAKAIHPVLVHAHFGPDGAAAVPLAEQLDIPLVVTLHGFDVTLHDREHARSILGRLYLQRRQKLWDRASLFICVSEFVKECAKEKGFPVQKLRKHYIGIDRSLFQAFLPAVASGSVIFVGRFVEKKGGEYLIRAISLLRADQPGLKLVLIGDGPLRSRWEELARELGVCCEFLGFLTPEAVRERLLNAAVFCVPSVEAANGDSEGLGMVFLEAQAMGIPVVSFRHGGIPEAVSNGHTGLLAEVGDVEGLATNLRAYLRDQLLRRACGENGKAWVRDNFDLAVQTRALEELYSEVLLGWSHKGQHAPTV